MKDHNKSESGKKTEGEESGGETTEESGGETT
jgi:hypothetical protein